ncbi:Flavin reductase-like, FMN-binding domain protein [mine drainage metagenome]|uniref:Flavin reductase-like, FMN-binding domain protein n=1 Tax=mine drainage metagenome TaxID=410659 RepID=T1BMD9_9ZZZZ
MTPASPGSAPDPAAFRALMGRWASGVAVVTGHADGRDAGLTVNALLSISLQPPSLLVSLTQDADTTPVIGASGRFGVSFLSATQRAVSERFARAIPSAEKFRDLPVRRGRGGVPLLEGALGTAECRVADWIPRHDHVLIEGEVVETTIGDPTALPLLFFGSHYGEASGPRDVRFPPPLR